MPTIRREGGGEHVVTDHIEGVLAIMLAIMGGGPPHVSAGRSPAVKALGDQDQRTERNPSLTLIVKLAKRLKTTPGKLLTQPD